MSLFKNTFKFLILFYFLTGNAFAATYQVGPERSYTDLQTVAPLLQPGDVVEVDGDTTYPGDLQFEIAGAPDNKITIRGIRINGNRPIISGGTNTVQFSTPWPYTGPGGDHYIFEGFEITGGTSRGIYHQAKDLTIRDVVVHDCPAHGILGADQGSGSLTLEYVEVYNCGEDSQRHQIYMATDEIHYPGSIFRMQHCYIHDGNGGNNVKSRAQRNEIYYNRIEGAYYHEIELIGPDGGDGGNSNLAREDSDVVGNVFRKTSNFYVARTGGDGTGETNGRYRFLNNTFICDDRAIFRLFDGMESIEMHNNIFVHQNGGIVDIFRDTEVNWSSGSELIAGSNNWVPENAINIPNQWTGTVAGADPVFEDFAGFNFRPAKGSPLINSGNQTPSGSPGYPFPSPLLLPAMHPPAESQIEEKDAAELRPIDLPIDIGAFETMTSNAVLKTRYPKARIHSPITKAVADNLKNIVDNGSGQNSNVFMIIGDSISAGGGVSSYFLGNFEYPYAQGGEPGWVGVKDLANFQGYSTALDFFLEAQVPNRSAEEDPTTPFARDSFAARVGMAASWPLAYDSEINGIPFNMEADAINPKYAIIMFGTNDVYGTGTLFTVQQKINTIISDLIKIIDACIARSIVPIVTAPPLRNSAQNYPDATITLQYAIRAACQDRQVPYINYLKTMTPLPNHGLGSDNIHPSVSSYNRLCVFDTQRLEYGYNMRNLITLQSFDRMCQIFENNEESLDEDSVLLAGSGTQADPFVVDEISFVDAQETSSEINEIFYRLDATSGFAFRTIVTCQDTTDIDILLLDQGFNELASDDMGVEYTLNPGTYYVKIENSGGEPANAGKYQLLIMNTDVSFPTTPGNFVVTLVSGTQVDLTWHASTDNVGVVGYKIYRDSKEIAVTDQTAYSDTTRLLPSTEYIYTVTSYDSADNESIAAVLTTVTTGSSAPVTNDIKLDYFGYRPEDTKTGIFTANPGASVEIRTLSDSVAYSIPTDGGSIISKGYDGATSGDTVWWVDFTSFASPGSYRLYSPSLDSQSYDFEIKDDIYNDVVLTALKTFYYQRCNTPKENTHGGDWADPYACHMSDLETEAASGHTDYGTLDLTGGWHDAGDYNKYVWSAVSTAILNMLRSYEDNPNIFRDGDLNIPESGNGIPDILDEIKWELDWLLKMQVSGGAVLSQIHVTGWDSDSPPSVDANQRYYQNPTLESGAVFAGTCALSSRIFHYLGMTGYAATLKTAAMNAWAWLQTQGDSDLKVWAAAEIFRTDNSVSSAQNYVDNYYSSDWLSRFFDIGHYDTHAAVTYVQTPAATASVVNNMRANISDMVNGIFSNNDFYRIGMYNWSYHWGSNSVRASYGLLLLAAAKIGETGSYTAEQCVEHAEDFLHFFHGQNALNMVYLTNMAFLGGEHSSFQFYHAWFGDSNKPYSLTNFIGKPASIIEPDYPYYKGTDNHGINDNKVSSLGPAPGFVPGGPNANYSGDAIWPQTAVYYNKFYRDWCDQTVWTAQTWEITENSIAYQGPYVALGAYFMADSAFSGDVNGDAQVNLSDAIIALKAATSMDTPNIRPNYLSSGADVNNNQLGIEEAVFVLQKVGGLRE